MHTPYAVLGVPDGSSLDVCKKAYRSLGKIYHPDNVATGDAAKFEEVNKAFKDIQAGITPHHVLNEKFYLTRRYLLSFRYII